MVEAKNNAEERGEQIGFQFPPKLDMKKMYEETPPKLDFVLPGFLAGTVGGLVSPGGVGKSYLGVEIAHDIATGTRLSGTTVGGHGRVVVLACEDSAEVLQHRIKEIGSRLTPGQRELGQERIDVHSCLGKSPDISRVGDLDAMERIASGTRLLIIDTLTRIHSLDENTAQDAKHIMAGLETVAARTGCAILFLHHVSKAAALGGLADLQQAARGSSVFVDNARWLSYLAVMDKDMAESLGVDDEGRLDFLRWNASKINYAKRGNDIWFKRGDGGILELYDISLMSLNPKKSKKGGYRAKA